MKLTPFFRWFDLWIGAYVDVKSRALYVCPVPMLGVKVELTPKWTAHAEGLHVYHRSRMSHDRYRYGVIERRGPVNGEHLTEYKVRWLDVPETDDLAVETCWHEELWPAPKD